ncbi:hypothetical protein [Streptomyces sp. 1331.2]|uniref:hypothetical protein n=1 Tax=Streptomyces sp. 1331.2 TaxID=1938835 RepID=UPI000BD4438A|nr:hypothetical protein [Streptomyces sp. 1331.2]SOB85075.1 hypothetical protein SAMN06272789_5345 [Streptomyces sp. 1331.2]
MLSATISFILTAGGVAVAGLRAYRRRFLSATRWFAVALLPAGLYLTGLFPLASTIGRAFTDWAAKLVLDPPVWSGIVLLGVSALLLVTTRWVGRRGTAPESAPERPAAAGPAPDRPALAPKPQAPKAAGKQAGDKRNDGLGDFADIEEILRKRGI